MGKKLQSQASKITSVQKTARKMLRNWHLVVSIVVLRGRVPGEPLLVELDDCLSALHVCLACRDLIRFNICINPTNASIKSVTKGNKQIWSYKNNWRTLTRSASSEPFHLMRNISSPDESVAPMIRSGSSPRSNPRGRSSSALRFFSVAGVDVEDEVGPAIWKTRS